MIDYKSTSGSDPLTERVPSANLDGPISLTWLWEIIVRTKRLPDDLDPKVLFIVLRDRLRNVEREVRQHALRVLADLIPVIEQNHLDAHMEFLLPDLIINLSHVAPAVRKSTIDVLRIYLKHSPHPNDMLKKLMTVVPEDSPLKQGLLMAVPYFSNHHISESTLIFLIGQLFLGTKQDFLRETSICSLVKTRSKIGADRFTHLLSSEKLQEFQELCKEHNIHDSNDDNVILETEITLETGPAITMKIHEEKENLSFSSNNFSDEERRDSEGELITRSPRKVHFGGEVVKMRTPESDSNHQSSDDTDVRTSVIIDRPTSIKITVSDNVASIKTRHKSMIPVRITTGSNPSTPRKKIKPQRLHKSAPDLGRLQISKIPLRHESRSPPKKKEQIEKGVRRHSRGEEQFSPVPVHNEIEVFHNLTRSPERSKETVLDEKDKVEDANTYPSFQVYKGEEKEEKANGLSPLEIIVRDLTHKEDTWTKTRALDDLITILRKNSVTFDSVTVSQMFQTLFLLEKQPRLQYRAQEALSLVISAISLQTLHEVYTQLCSDVIKVLPPPGVRLSLLVMKRSSPRKFFETLKVDRDREATLQAMIAAARTFPSSEIDLNKGIQLAFEAMKDDKRAVRQAALETLATLAQVAGNTMILQTVNEMSKNVDDPENLLTIVRTRLSRRQLPTVEFDGSIRYSSPREQAEFDWLCGGVPSLHKTSSLNSIKLPPSNYWKHNLRHDLDLPVIRSPSACDSSYLRNHAMSRTECRAQLEQYIDQPTQSTDILVILLESAMLLCRLYALRPISLNNFFPDDSNNGNKEQIWALDSTFPKIDGTAEKATLCPVYVLHRNSSVNGKTYRNYDRGRSNSPPNRRRNDSQEAFSDVDGNKAKRFFRQSEQFRKSFSSEHIYNGNGRSQEPTSFSLSSRSSSTSTGSSAKSGIWLREFRSGIPIPINSETKLKFRSHRQSSESFTGPLIAQELANRTKLESPQNTPIIRRSSPQQFTQLPPPSSGSESSGYFTPPAEHHLKDQLVERFIPDESFEENNNFEVVPEPNFQVVESETETQELDVIQRQSSASSAESTGRIEDVTFEEIEKEVEEEPKRYTPLDETDFNENPRFTEPRSKSRSEGNFKSTLPEIIERKNINSAPPFNDVNVSVNVNIVPYSFADSQQISPVLPGSVASSDNTPTKNHSDQTPKRLIRRSISVRTSSVKRSHKSAKTIEVRPVSRPKEILSQGLAQMESCDWETTIQGLNTLIRLSRSHPEVLELQMHPICVALGKTIRNLRSQVARTACLAASELFSSCKKGLEVELEELASPLLQRTADTNKFLRSDANSALDVMSLNISAPRVVAVVTSKGSTHQNSVVRAAATRLLSDLAMRIGPEKVFQLPKEIRDKLLFVGANGLTEGSLDTRRYAKALMSTLAGHPHFQKALMEAVPQHTMRHIAKVINSLK